MMSYRWAVLIVFVVVSFVRGAPELVQVDTEEKRNDLDPLPTALNASATRERLDDSSDETMRILYIVTSSVQRTGRGYRGNRIQEVVAPVIFEGVESLLAYNYSVDLYLVLGYTIDPENEKFLQEKLPKEVDFQIWNDATPFDYEERDKRKIRQIGRALARQHRYVIKDKLLDYDFFVVFEDDMKITGAHVRYFLDMSEKIKELRDAAPEKVSGLKGGKADYYGQLTKQQLSHVFPGFLRVEVLGDEENFRAQEKKLDFPVDDVRIDPGICCNVTHIGQHDRAKNPQFPESDKLILWETGLEGVSIRKMPSNSSLGWVALLAGPRWGDGYIKDKYFANDMTSKVGRISGASNPRHLANMGGWMATREQIWDFHTNLCQGGFLPPFDDPHFPHDGLYLKNVEYWSGGIEMWCAKDGCNMQRIVSLDPELFQYHLLYHTANNKQNNGRVTGHQQLKKVNTFFGQLSALRRNLEQQI